MKRSTRFNTIKHPFHEHNLFVSRALVMLFIMILVFILLFIRLGYLQVLQHSKYSVLSRDNMIRFEAIPPTRGLIFDRNGKLLAENISTHRLEVTREKVKDMDGLIQTLSHYVDFTPKMVKDFHKRLKQNPKFTPVPLKFNLTEEEVAALSANLHKFSGVQITAGLMRFYPYGNELAHVLGFVGRINEQELSKLDIGVYRGTHYIGKNGIESFYETILHGKPGWREIEIDAFGRPTKVISNKPPVHGKNITLTIDLDLQKQAIKALGDKRGAVVVVDPRNGEILALISQPSFDPNLFVKGIDHKTYQALLQDKEKPLFNRFLRGQYPPASTIKPHLGLAGLEEGKITARTTIQDPGWYQLKEDSRVYRDWKRDGHGLMNLNRALRESCDTYFYELAHRLGIQDLSQWLTAFGFGQKTNIDLNGENQGIVPNAKWKRHTLGKPWYPGETLIAGIGQGYVLATPLQLAQSTVILANRGSEAKMHLLKEQTPPALMKKVEASEKNWSVIEDAMHEVVHNYRGTAWGIGQKIKFQMAGKTGTAQVFSLQQQENIKQKELPEHLRDHSLFIGFAPRNHPSLAIAVIVENNHGSAEISESILNYYLESPRS